MLNTRSDLAVQGLDGAGSKGDGEYRLLNLRCQLET